jgi:DtxR family Mn-dependent transcriptional regulator
MPEAVPENLSASLEDYLEVIFNLAGRSGVARSKDIASSLSVARSSVTGALKLLTEKGLVNYRPYDFISLTDDGAKAAEAVSRKHNVLKSFFVSVLGINTEKAQRAACKAEHALGPEVITRLLSFIEFATKQGEDGYDLAGKFSRFCRTRAGK